MATRELSDYEAELEVLLAHCRERLWDSEMAPVRLAVMNYRTRAIPLHEASPGLLPAALDFAQRIATLLDAAEADIGRPGADELLRTVEAGLPGE